MTISRWVVKGAGAGAGAGDSETESAFRLNKNSENASIWWLDSVWTNERMDGWIAAIFDSSVFDYSCRGRRHFDVNVKLFNTVAATTTPAPADASR